MSALEFSEWMAYNRIDPFGNGRSDLQSAMICSTHHNRTLGKSERPSSASDYMPKFEDRRKKVGVAEKVRALFKKLAGMQNSGEE